MRLEYPGQWGGTAFGHTSSGHVSVSGEDFERIEGNGTMVKVERRPLGSNLLFETETGTAELVLKPCDEPGCGYPKSSKEL